MKNEFVKEMDKTKYYNKIDDIVERACLSPGKKLDSLIKECLIEYHNYFIEEKINCNGVKYIVMDTLKESFPERFNESGAMDYDWFEKTIRPMFNCFIRLDVKSIAFSYSNEKQPLSFKEAQDFLQNKYIQDVLKGDV